MKRLISNYRLKKQIIFFVVSVIFIPVFLLNTVFAYLYVNFYNSKIDDSYISFQKESYTNLNYKLQLYQSMMERTVYNSTISDLLAGINASDRQGVYDVVTRISYEMDNLVLENAMEEFYDLCIYYFQPNIKLPTGRYLRHIGNIEMEPWLRELKNKPKYIFIENRAGNDLLSFAQVMYYTDKKTGDMTPVAVVKLEMYLSRLLTNSIKEGESNVGIKIFDDEKIHYQYGNNSDKKTSNLFCIDSSLFEDTFQIRYIFDKTDQKKITNLIILGFLLGAILVLTILILIIVRFSNRINKRVTVILDKLQRIEQGDFDIEASLDGSDEFNDIEKKTQKMAREIERAINENYIIEAERKQAELRALQMQINPHFMFNTLETINSMAKQSGCDEIGFISCKMAEILRYNIDGTSKYVSVKEEFENIKSYLDIQCIRYSNRFEVFYDISEEAAQCRMLKFILQPIVENAIKHAIQEGEGRYFICAAAKVTDGFLYITISDDGKGISEKRLESIKENLTCKTTDKTKNIGLKNVYLRMKITYGEACDFSITSKEGVGTSVVLKFPTENQDRKAAGK